MFSDGRRETFQVSDSFARLISSPQKLHLWDLLFFCGRMMCPQFLHLESIFGSRLYLLFLISPPLPFCGALVPVAHCEQWAI